MDDVQLRRVLDFRRYEYCHVGTRIINARDRLILVCSLIYFQLPSRLQLMHTS
jgi:hypothetical protein